jgi:PAP2 superfamily protein
VALTWIPWNVAVETAAVVGTAGVAGRVARKRWITASAALARELAIVLVLYALWRVVGTISIVKVDGARHVGTSIWDVERALHLPNERGLQHLFLKSSVLIQACNAYYASVHIPSMLIFLPWLWFRYRDRYPPIRNVVALTTLWCLAIQLIPVAPPRLIPSLHVADTPALFHQTVYPAFGANGPAQLSAMPSVHVAWAVIIGVAIVMISTSRYRWFFLAHPVVTTVVVVVTGNHYWLDGVVAIGVLALAVVFEQWRRNRWGRRITGSTAPAPRGTPDGPVRYDEDLPPVMSR